jgi:hypothetical protein
VNRFGFAIFHAGSEGGTSRTLPAGPRSRRQGTRPSQNLKREWGGSGKHRQQPASGDAFQPHEKILQLFDQVSSADAASDF